MYLSFRGTNLIFHFQWDILRRPLEISWSKETPPGGGFYLLCSLINEPCGARGQQRGLAPDPPRAIRSQSIRIFYLIFILRLSHSQSQRESGSIWRQKKSVWTLASWRMFILKKKQNGSWSRNIVNRKPPRGGRFFRSICTSVYWLPVWTKRFDTRWVHQRMSNRTVAEHACGKMKPTVLIFYSLLYWNSQRGQSSLKQL